MRKFIDIINEVISQTESSLEAEFGIFLDHWQECEEGDSPTFSEYVTMRDQSLHSFTTRPLYRGMWANPKIFDNPRWHVGVHWSEEKWIALDFAHVSRHDNVYDERFTTRETDGCVGFVMVAKPPTIEMIEIPLSIAANYSWGESEIRLKPNILLTIRDVWFLDDRGHVSDEKTLSLNRNFLT